MSKLKLSVLASLVVLGALATSACGSDNKEVVVATDETPVEQAEVVESVKRYWQWNSTDASVPSDQRLYCWYTVVERGESDTKFAQAEVNTSGQCDWKSLATQAGAPTKTLPANNATNLTKVIEGVEFPAGKGAKWDCAALEVTTNLRTFTTYDCSLADRNRPAEFGDPMGGATSKSAEEAAWRLNQLIYMK